MEVAFTTLGCKVNQYESEILAARFREAGYQVVEFTGDAQVFVVNSCTVTGEGDRKARRLLRRVRRRCPGAVTVLTGCYPQAFPLEAAAVEEADVVTGARGRDKLVEAVERFLSTGRRVVDILPHSPGEPFEAMHTAQFHGHTRAFVKIQDGCDQYCAYCIIPTARGPVRSKPLAELEAELGDLAAAGYREAVLAGINLSKYGVDLGTSLCQAVERACRVEALARVRLGSLEPNLLTPQDIAALASQPKLCPQFHLALQSGCDATLARMGRRYTTAQYAQVARQLREHFPGAALTTDVMVGFPGETEAEFEATLAFVEEMAFARLHVFSYSPRPGTRAADMGDQVAEATKADRSRRLTLLREAMGQRFLAALVGTRQTILVEGGLTADGRQEGQTPGGTPVRFWAQERLRGRLLEVAITGFGANWCDGAVL